MSEELREKAKAFAEKHREQGTDGWQLMADFAKHHAAECVRAEQGQIAGKIEMIIRHTTDGSLVGFQNLADELKSK